MKNHKKNPKSHFRGGFFMYGLGLWIGVFGANPEIMTPITEGKGDILPDHQVG